MQIQFVIPARLWWEKDTGSFLVHSFACLLRFLFAVYCMVHFGRGCSKRCIYVLQAEQRDMMLAYPSMSSTGKGWAHRDNKNLPAKAFSNKGFVEVRRACSSPQMNYVFIYCSFFHWKTTKRVALGKTRCALIFHSWGRLSGAGSQSTCSQIPGRSRQKGCACEFLFSEERKNQGLSSKQFNGVCFSIDLSQGELSEESGGSSLSSLSLPTLLISLPSLRWKGWFHP